MRMLEGYLNCLVNSPDQSALCIDGKEISYTELNNLAKNIASQIKSESSLIGFYTSEDEFPYLSILASLYLGKGFVPLNYKFPDERLIHIYQTTEIDTIVCREKDISLLKKRLDTSKINFIFIDEKLNTSINFNPKPIDPAAIAYILFTSGSTGTPKGIPISFGNLEALINSLDQYFVDDSFNSVLQAFEFSFDVSIACTFFAWKRGASIHAVNLSNIVPLNTYKVINSMQTEFVTLPPSSAIFMDQMNILEGKQIEHIKYSLFTGEALSDNMKDKWQSFAPASKIYNAYGPTENTVWSFMYQCNEETSKESINGLVPIGKPLNGFEYFIDGDQLEGELYTSGPQVAKAYHQNSEKTEVTFIEKNGKIWYKSGDWVVENEQGNLVYINRIDNQVQVNGYRVELAEIEFSLKKICKSEMVAVIAIENAVQLIEIHAFVENKEEEISNINAALRNHIPKYMLPKRIHSIAKMPINNSGKIDRSKLKEM